MEKWEFDPQSRWITHYRDNEVIAEYQQAAPRQPGVTKEAYNELFQATNRLSITRGNVIPLPKKVH